VRFPPFGFRCLRLCRAISGRRRGTKNTQGRLQNRVAAREVAGSSGHGHVGLDAHPLKQFAIGHQGLPGRQVDRDAIAEVVRLGEAYSIATEYTSFLVLENDGEYQRWKIDQRNALRIARDRKNFISA
jgi:hypothetical protein